jgi:hypothetical protein
MTFDWTNPYKTTRTPVFARNIVSTSQPLAAQAGLRILQQAAGPRFAAGLLLHDGEQVIPFGERLWAMPIERLWTEPGRQ